MKLSDQVCTLEQAKKLMALGIDADAINAQFVWHNLNLPEFTLALQIDAEEWANKPKRGANIGEVFSAFTVAELGVMLPNTINDRAAIILFQNNLPKESEGRFVAMIVMNSWEQRPLRREYGRTEAEARAALLIHLLESGKVTAEEVNSRLQF